MKIYLDSNAWMSVINSEIAMKPLLADHQAGRFRLIVSQENLNELRSNENIKTQILERNIRAIEPLVSEAVADKIFVIGHGRLGFARLGNEKSASSFERHMFKKNVNSNNLADGVHLVNAINHRALLVSCDDALRKSSQREQHPFVCLKVWFNEYRWETSRLEVCGCKPLDASWQKFFEA
jgi:predicted nucleic acid-binding protein